MVRSPRRVLPPAQLGQRTAQGTALNVAFLADTGCRGMVPHERARMQQDCADLPVHNDAQSKWAFPVVAQQIADSSPDLVIHGGDYHYFYEESKFSTFWVGFGRNRFEYWMYEFLDPAQPMLRVSPHVFARGNHEICQSTWFGNGWFELFGPRVDPKASASDGTALNACALPQDPPKGTHSGLSQTWWFDVAPRNDTTVKPYRFYVVDSGNDANAQFHDVFKEAATPGRDKAWITHIPPTMMLRYKAHHEHHARNYYADTHVMSAVTSGLQQGAGCSGYDCWPAAIFTGHQHLYQKVELSASASLAPGTIITEVHIAGHGGTAWDTGGPKADGTPWNDTVTSCRRWLRGAKNAKKNSRRQEVFGQDDLHVRFTTASRHGFLLMDRRQGTSTPSGWKITPQWTPGLPAINATVHKGDCPK